MMFFPSTRFLNVDFPLLAILASVGLLRVWVNLWNLEGAQSRFAFKPID